jgi:hypothetical protein
MALHLNEDDLLFVQSSNLASLDCQSKRIGHEIQSKHGKIPQITYVVHDHPQGQKSSNFLHFA